MVSSFEFEGIDWEGSGYFGCPVPEDEMDFPIDPLIDPWLTWAIVLKRTKLGYFGHLDVLLNVYTDTSDPVLQELCVMLLGDAAPDIYFVPMVEELRNPSNPQFFEMSLDFSDALSVRGRLIDVPLILQVYQTKAEIEDADIFPVLISDLLGSDELAEPADFSSLVNYSEAVMERYEGLVAKLGSTEIYVYQGQIFNILNIARRILDASKTDSFDSDLRRKFEVSTGINCSQFYAGGIFQPLSATAIVEEFLENPTISRFEDGKRYFFGRVIK